MEGDVQASDGQGPRGGFRVHYNMVRTHSTLGKTPGEAAGLPKVSGFRWSRILKEATRNDTSSKPDA